MSAAFNPLANPPFRTPLYDASGNLTNPWALFFNDLTTAASAVRYGSNADRLAASTINLADGTLWVETDTGLIYQWQQAADAWVFIAGTFAAATAIIDVTMTGATTVNVPTSGVVELVVILRQDATGGRTLTWGSGFSGVSSNIDTTASTISVFRFVLQGGKYVMTSQPTTGMTP